MYAIWWGYVEKGHYPFAAKITGFDSKYTFKREFVQGYHDYTDATKSRRYGVRVYFPLEPNTIYDVREVGQGDYRYRAFLLTDNLGGWQEISKEEVVEWLKKRTSAQQS